jgi:hypothetical protein
MDHGIFNVPQVGRKFKSTKRKKGSRQEENYQSPSSLPEVNVLTQDGYRHREYT